MNRLVATAALLLGLIIALITTGLDAVIIQRMTELPEPFRALCAELTEYGKSEYYLVPAVLAMLLFAWRGHDMRRAAISLYIFACLALPGLVVNIIKPIVGRPRPKEVMEYGAHGFDPFTLESRWHSFPSGHACTMISLVLAVWPWLPPVLRAPLLAWAGTIIATRPIVAAHYLSDVLAGALVAIVVCTVLEQQTRQRWPHLFGH
jgi:membrane-associated phospholipid phosphatase